MLLRERRRRNRELLLGSPWRWAIYGGCFVGLSSAALNYALWETRPLHAVVDGVILGAVMTLFFGFANSRQAEKQAGMTPSRRLENSLTT
jgi:hypothetical protein